jgi:hypothetical protein
MKQLFVVAVALLISHTVETQQHKTPVSVSRTGKDRVGSRFVEAFNRELSHSPGYEPMSKSEKGFRFFVEFITIDVANAVPEEGNRSVVSVVIQQMGLPNSFPVADMWYHKVIVVDRSTVDATAKELLEDMTARWCSYPKDSIGGCPKEKFEPKLSPH